ncbi:uncharacterized protein BX664DRAFT_320484 [Halteromyces radiatus]|uniref:uncharacterized protein n=1 Tax=Halteromyces radiatus TaxID=101107 RepID=UPI00221EE187|nr:uncharacterized protein BX664DRAFT_320484 [Halteromyces radiatus]KAI8099133.1 hypothetical protein BX664DRAFT_320484 [Halteromyces radiatus]
MCESRMFGCIARSRDANASMNMIISGLQQRVIWFCAVSFPSLLFFLLNMTQQLNFVHPLLETISCGYTSTPLFVTYFILEWLWICSLCLVPVGNF